MKIRKHMGSRSRRLEVILASKIEMQRFLLLKETSIAFSAFRMSKLTLLAAIRCLARSNADMIRRFRSFPLISFSLATRTSLEY